MSHGLVKLFSLGIDLLIGLVQIVGLKEVSRVFFSCAASEYFVKYKQKRDDAHVDYEGVDLPSVEEMVIDYRQNSKDREQEYDEFD